VKTATESTVKPIVATPKTSDGAERGIPLPALGTTHVVDP
jgi:hypothetical protein